MVTFDPNRPDFAPYGFTCVRWNPSPMRRPDRHNEVEINFLESGWLTYLLGGRKVRVEANRLTAFWAAIPHQIIDFGEETEYFVATLPLPWFLQCRLPEHLVQPLLQGQMVTEPTADHAVHDSQHFSQWEHDLKLDNAQLRKAALLEMEARLLRLALAVPTGRAAAVSPRKRPVGLSEGGLNKVEQMACLIAQHYTDRLTVEEIGKSVKLHPNYAMSLFQKTFGTTLIEYLTQHRVSHAQRLLATSDMKIVDVAFSSGFTSISRFNDAFRRACGCSPRQYRQHHQQFAD
ncbi:helix-turn-helix domain-containing protein [Opitutus sp. ER46]|uniref:helix-turn-helix domain-containing protein n=1 Tax=Opitutus sp. ER46 TaxID=2161864 RepID=UPI000D303618|nr:helix-turn-helix domain-containing protein [Opitutus sp. ER46]PTX94654.1 AraC family transcriptional regulator [Opitutus sp. ER46]